MIISGALSKFGVEDFYDISKNWLKKPFHRRIDIHSVGNGHLLDEMSLP